MMAGNGMEGRYRELCKQQQEIIEYMQRKYDALEQETAILRKLVIKMDHERGDDNDVDPDYTRWLV